MKRYALILLAVVVATGGCIWLLAIRPATPASPPPLLNVTSAPPPAIPAMPSAEEKNAPGPAAIDQGSATSDTTPANAAEPGGLPPLTADPVAAKERIQQLAMTFNEAEVPALARYLEHASPEVRLEAASGLVLLGDMSAAPYLQAAANRAELLQATSEATTLREAAELLAKPRLGEPKMPKSSQAGLVRIEGQRPRHEDGVDEATTK